MGDADIQRVQGQRIREERKRLGYSQSDFGALAGLQRLTQALYESGKRSPPLRYLDAIAGAGADAYYIVTGRRQTNAVPVGSEFRQIEVRAMEMVEAYLRKRDISRLSGQERFVLFDAFREQLWKE